MKELSETHPSLKNCRFTIDGHIQKIKYKDGTTENLFRGREIQKYTIDKAILKDMIFDESLFPFYDKHYRNYLCKKLGLEENRK